MDANGNDVKNVGSYASVETELDKIGHAVIRLQTSDSSTDINDNILFPWETAGIIDSGTYSYTSGNRYLTIDESGTYEVQVNIGIDKSSADSRMAPRGRLFRNRNSSGGGGTMLRAAGKTGYIRNANGHDESSLHLSWIGNFVGSDTVSIQMDLGGDGGTCNAAPNQTNMYVKQIGRP